MSTVAYRSPRREKMCSQKILTTPEPAERTVVIVDECLIDAHSKESEAEPTAKLSGVHPNHVNNEDSTRQFPSLANKTEMKAPVIVRPQIASATHDHPREELVDVDYSDPAAPPPAVFRHSTRISRFSAQSGNRNSKIATVRPQQHMIVNNSSESSDGGSPPETVKSRLRRFSSASNDSHTPSFENGAKKYDEQESPKKSITTMAIGADVLRCSSPTVVQRTLPSSTASAVFYTANDDKEAMRSPLPATRRQPSDYAQIGELQQYFASDEYDPKEERTPTKSAMSTNNLGQSFSNNEDDTISVAGTDFNEPWDSNAWCNLLDLARFGDEKPTTAQAIKALHSAETIFEEDDLSSPEELTLRGHHPHGDYFFDDELTSNVASEERFDSMPRSLYSGGSARGGSATGACARRQPVATARHPLNHGSYQLQQYLNIIPERESGEFGADSSRNRASGSTLGSQRRSATAASQVASGGGGEAEAVKRQDSDVNVEMEAAAMAAVLGSCGPRSHLGAAYTAEDDGRVPASAKLSHSVDDNVWRYGNLHNCTFRYVAADDVENRPRNDAIESMNDVFANNNSDKASSVAISGESIGGQPPARPKPAGARMPPPHHRLKSSSSFSTPLGASSAANRPSATSVTASTLRVGGSVGDASSLNSYGRRRGQHYGSELTRDTQSLHRMPHNEDLLHSSLNNISARLTAMSPIAAPTRFRNAQSDVGEPSAILQRYVEQLASDESTLFGGTLHKFIECTVESEETDPHVVIRRVRQFLNGMKNYLVKNGQGGLHALIERESAKLNANEFLNIDVIFETVLTKIVLVPIKGHLYHLMVFENTRNGDLQRLSENLSAVRAMDPTELGFPAGTVMPDAQTMEQVRAYLRRMQNHYSPLKKLENLLKALSLAVTRSLVASAGDTDGGCYALPMRSQSGDMLAEFGSFGLGGDSGTLDSRVSSSIAAAAFRQPPHSTPLSGTRHAPSATEQFLRSSNKHQSTERLTARVDASGAVTLSAMAKRLPSEDLIRWMVYLLAKSSAINCEIEAWYMWELLPQQMVTNGEAEYYLSMFFTAVNMLKKPESIRRLKRQSRMTGNVSGVSSGTLATLPENFSASSYSSDAFLRIAVPNELEGSISYHIFPVLPQMNVVKLCRVIAHQFAVTNPEDYGLYVLYDNFETILLSKEFPQAIHDRLIEERKMHLFVYKRRETRIAWPKNAYACCMPVGEEQESLLAQ